MTSLRAALAVAVVLAPALATGQESDMPRIDNSVPFEELPTPIDIGPNEVDISNEIFGKRDEAFGAYQRGFYLTALALDLGEKNRVQRQLDVAANQRRLSGNELRD